MSDDTTKEGLGFVGLLCAGLTILFVALKLLGVIDWAWYWVMSPAIAYVCCSLPCVIVVVLVVSLIGGVAIGSKVKEWWDE